jgi:hypothetical protein
MASCDMIQGAGRAERLDDREEAHCTVMDDGAL